LQKLAIAIAAIATLASTSVFAADMPVNAPPATVWSWSGFYIGAGGSFNWTRFDQALQGISGIQNITIGPNLVAQAQEGGPYFDFNRNKSGFAPGVQLGYMVPFAGGEWQAGLKFTYKYVNIESKENVSIPQEGTLTTVVGPPMNVPITGFVQISPAEINLKHQFAYIATIGRAFNRFTIYGGGGPTLFGVETNFKNGIPFAIIGSQTVMAGEPVSASNHNWVWGGAAQVGVSYALAPRWFLDFAYTYARSGSFKIQNSVNLTSPTRGPLMSSGSAVLNTHEQVTNQSVMLTLNRQFDF
jgi:opacity protein-like surface antigen